MTRQGAAAGNLPGLILSTMVLAGCLAAPSASASPPTPPASSEPVATGAPTPTPSPTPEPTPDQARVPILAAGAMAATRTTVRVRDLPGTQWGATSRTPMLTPVAEHTEPGAHPASA